MQIVESKLPAAKKRPSGDQAIVLIVFKLSPSIKSYILK